MAGDRPHTSEHALSLGAPPSLPGPTMPGRRGGTLRRGNPGNRGNPYGRRSTIAREILEASTPEAARILKQMSLNGTVGRGNKRHYLSDADRIKAVIAHLDRGGVPARSEVGVDGAPFTILIDSAKRSDKGVQEAHRAL